MGFFIIILLIFLQALPSASVTKTITKTRPFGDKAGSQDIVTMGQHSNDSDIAGYWYGQG